MRRGLRGREHVLLMTVHPRLAPLLDDLDIAYMAAEEPQRLDVVVETAGSGELPLPLWTVSSWAEAVSRGLGGGGTFAAGTSSAVPVSGFDLPPPGVPLPARWELSLEVSSVCPTLLRPLVEGFAGSGHPHALTRLSVFGSRRLGPDRQRGIRGADVAAWLREARGFPARTEEVPFPVTVSRVTKGLVLRVELRSGDTSEAAPRVADLFSSWQDLVLTYPRAYGPERGIMAPAPVLGRTRTAVLLRLPLFDHAVGPAVDLLVNGLAALHAGGLAIAAVHVGHP